MRIVFIVQGEGRGHMTQAISLRQALVNQGHDVVATLVGKSKRRQIPAFFSKQMEGEVYAFHSPNFYTRKDGKGINPWKTLSGNLSKFHLYARSLRFLHRWMETLKPDVIINFYDLLGGIYALIHRPSIPYLVVGHQYLAAHPDFPFAPGILSKWLFQCSNSITSFHAKAFFALSYAPYPPSGKENLKILPPLLRQEVFQLEPAQEGFFLAYVVNAGYGSDLMDWHLANRQVELHCFWDNPSYPEAWSPHENLTFHPIDDRKFLQKLAKCKAYICTAGFESVCEALYLGKPILTIPVEGQYEQACNALDASRLTQVMHGSNYDLSPFITFVEAYYARKTKASSLKAWYHKGSALMVDAILDQLEPDHYALPVQGQLRQAGG